MLMDQNFGSGSGVFVDFFGRKAATATGPIVFALRTQASIIPAFIFRNPDNRHQLIIEPELNLEQREDKDEMIKKEADLWLPRTSSKYNFFLTIKDNVIIPSAGIDESNSNGVMTLWPEKTQEVVNEVRAYLAKKYSLKNIGVIITDSKTSPLKWGTTGVTLAHSGFLALNDYVGTEDIFGRTMEVTKSNIAEALAAAAVVVMGEGKEQTPIAMIEDVPFVQFQDRNPTKKELKELTIDIADDVYEPLLSKVKWQKGTK